MNVVNENFMVNIVDVEAFTGVQLDPFVCKLMLSAHNLLLSS